MERWRRGFLRSGDILVFSGRDLASWLVRIWTLSRYSHVGIICRHACVYVLWEATTLSDLRDIFLQRPVRGVQAVLPIMRLSSYRGRIWRMRPRMPLTHEEERRLGDWLSARHGQPYDLQHAVLEAGRWTRWLYGQAYLDERWFCSEIIVAALLELGRLRPEQAGRPSAWRPADVVKWFVRYGLYEPPQRIR